MRGKSRGLMSKDELQADDRLRGIFTDAVARIRSEYSFSGRTEQSQGSAVCTMPFREDAELVGLLEGMSYICRAASFIDVFAHGFTAICRQIIARYGPFEHLVAGFCDTINFDGQVQSPSGESYTLPVTFHDHGFRGLGTYENVQTHFLVGIESGLDNLCIPTSAESYFACLLKMGDMTLMSGDGDFINSALKGIDLPFVVRGKLDNPELVMAYQRRDFGELAGGYRSMLCWATPEMLTEFHQELTQIDPVSKIRLKAGLAEGFKPAGRKQSTLCISLGDVDYDFNSYVDRHYSGSFEWCVEALEFGLESPGSADQNAFLSAISLYGSIPTRYGLELNAGRVLCFCSAEFLCSLSAASSRPEHLESCERFFSSVVPIRNVISHSGRDEINTKAFALSALFRFSSLYSIFGLFLNDSLRHHLFGVVPRSLLEHLIDYPPPDCLPELELVKRRYMGRGDEPVKFSLTIPNRLRLATQGYRFPAGSELTFDAAGLHLFGHSMLADMVKGLVDMSDGEISINSVPTCLSPKLAVTERFHADQAAYLVLVNLISLRAIGDVKQGIATGDDWRLLVDAFGIGHFSDFLHLVPSAIKVQGVLDDFNI